MTSYPGSRLDNLEAGAAQHKRVTVTSAQILACNTTPVTLIPAPGARYALVLDRVVVRNEFLTGAYAWTTIGNISYTDESGTVLVAFIATFLESIATTIAAQAALATLTGAPAAATQVNVNAPIVFGAPDADPTTGAGSLVIDLYYRTVLAA